MFDQFVLSASVIGIESSKLCSKTSPISELPAYHLFNIFLHSLWTTNMAPSSFLELPLEIRIMIYTHVFEDLNVVRHDRRDFCLDNCTKPKDRKATSKSLYFTCKQTKTEAKPIFEEYADVHEHYLEETCLGEEGCRMSLDPFPWLMCDSRN